MHSLAIKSRSRSRSHSTCLFNSDSRSGVQKARSVVLELLLSSHFPSQDIVAYSTPIHTPSQLEHKHYHFFFLPLEEKEIAFQAIRLLIECYKREGDAGKVLTLVQFAWPYFHGAFVDLLEGELNKGFSFEKFFDYIVNIFLV